MKKTKILAAIAVVAALLVLAAVWIRLRNSFVIKPDKGIAEAGAVYYCQKDATWKGDYLGASAYQMEHSGCLTTCIASVLQMEHIDTMDPKATNQLFSDNAVYDGQGNIQWDALEACMDVKVTRRNITNTAEIESLLQAGIYPIVRVRVCGIGNYHYVVLTGSSGNTFLCMDPLNETQEAVPLAAFGDRIYAMRYIEPA